MCPGFSEPVSYEAESSAQRAVLSERMPAGQITEVALHVRSLHGLMAGIQSHKLRISFATLGTFHRITEWIGSDS